LRSCYALKLEERPSLGGADEAKQEQGTRIPGFSGFNNGKHKEN
jgi:hypothetical protein